MKRGACILLLGLSLLTATGCKKTQNQNDAIRAGVVQHLSAVNGLNLDAMDMKITNVTINGNQAQAQVEFHLKSNSSPEAGMKISYNLEKRGDTWVVVKKPSPDGGAPQGMPGELMPSEHPSVPPAAPKS